MTEFRQVINGGDSKLGEPGGQPSVQRYPLTGIDVLIIGGGVGGLTAALECYRKGHSVRVFERDSVMSVAGDMFTIGLSARRWLKHWPEMQKEFEEISPRIEGVVIKKHTGEVAVPLMPMGPPTGKGPMNGLGSGPGVAHALMGSSGPPSSMAPPGHMGPPEIPMVIQIRSQFHQTLYHQVLKLGISITYNKLAISYSEDSSQAYVLTDDQQSASADLIIAADGIGSKSGFLINGGKVEAKTSGQAVYRAVVDTKSAMEDEVAKDTFGLRGGQEAVIQQWLGPNTHCMVLVRKENIIWGLYHNESNSDTSSKESWHNTVHPSQVLKTLSATPGWSEGMRALILKTPSSNIINWPLIWRNPSPIWHSPQARIIQVGDSAHSFLPTSGNGATQAMEDAISLASCLQLASSSLRSCSTESKDVPVSEIVPLAVKAHNKLRFERVSCAQKLGFVNASILHNVDWEEVKKDSRKAQHKAPMWIWKHDPEAYVEEKWGGVRRWVEDGGREGEFVNTNIPKGFVWNPWKIDDLMEGGKHRVVELEGDWS